MATLDRSRPDPHPEFRCRCVSWMTDGWKDEWHQRCPARPTQEDGLCDHCRQDQCADPGCFDMTGEKGWGCCRQSYGERELVPLTTPCAALTEEVNT